MVLQVPAARALRHHVGDQRAPAGSEAGHQVAREADGRAVPQVIEEPTE